eukprot:jgi/Psemu1/10270/gm1.10270_g
MYPESDFAANRAELGGNNETETEIETRTSNHNHNHNNDGDGDASETEGESSSDGLSEWSADASSTRRQREQERDETGQNTARSTKGSGTNTNNTNTNTNNTDTEQQQQEQQQEQQQQQQQQGPTPTRWPRVVPIESLPPLPEPNKDWIREETVRGMCGLAALLAGVLFLTHYVALTVILPSNNDNNNNNNNNSDNNDNNNAAVDDDDDDDEHSNTVDAVRTALLVLVYAEAATCFPLPVRVAEWLADERDAAATPTEQQRDQRRKLDRYYYDYRGDENDNNDNNNNCNDNNNNNENKGVYCTRCLVWRKPRDGPSSCSYFHCAICQRCCAYHDHHCNVFGRCIAGRLDFWKQLRWDHNKDDTNTISTISTIGNKIWFVLLLGAAGWGYVTVVAVAWGCRPITVLLDLVVGNAVRNLKRSRRRRWQKRNSGRNSSTNTNSTNNNNTTNSTTTTTNNNNNSNSNNNNARTGTDNENALNDDDPANPRPDAAASVGNDVDDYYYNSDP